jgi:hypothetical protein
MKRENDVVDVAKTKFVITEPALTYRKISVELNREIAEYTKLKYTNNDAAIDSCEQKEFECIIKIGLVHAKQALFSKESILLHKGKKPRNDVWQNLGKIASEFLKCNTYPTIPSNYLSAILNKALGNRDHRVVQDYRRTVLLYCNTSEELIKKSKGIQFGNLDVSLFVQLIPKKYIVMIDTTSSTSFVKNEGEGKNPSYD